MPKRKKKKATAIEIADIVIKAVVAVAALITAISQWKQPEPEGRKLLPLVGYLYYTTVKGVLQVKKSDIWFLVLAVFFMLDVASAWNIWINICTIICAIVVLAECTVRLIGVIRNARNKA